MRHRLLFFIINIIVHYYIIPTDNPKFPPILPLPLYPFSPFPSPVFHFPFPISHFSFHFP